MADAVTTETEEQARPSDPPYPSTVYAWYCVFILLGIYLNSFLDRNILALLVEDIKLTMDVSDSQMGFMIGPAFALFYTVMGLPIGWFADRISRRLLIAIGQLFWSIASVCFGLGRNYGQLLAARVGVGVGEASLSPSAYSLIADLFPPNRLGRALSVYGMGIYVGGGLANLLGGILLGVYDPQEIHRLPLIGDRTGWQIVFFWIAAPTIPLTLMLLTLREPKRRGQGMERDAQGTLRPVNVPISMFLRYAWRNKGTVLCHGFGFAFLSFSGYGAAAWVPAFFMRLHEWSPAQVGTWVGINGMIVGPLGLFFGGWLGDRLAQQGYRDSKMRAGVVSAVVWFPFGIALPLMPNGELAFAFLIPATFFAAMSWGIAPAAIQEIMPNQMRGQASAVYLFIINLIGLGLGPQVLPLVTDYIFADEMQVHLSLLWTTAGAHVIAALLLWRGLSYFRDSRDYLDRWLAERS